MSSARIARLLQRSAASGFSKPLTRSVESGLVVRTSPGTGVLGLGFGGLLVASVAAAKNDDQGSKNTYEGLSKKLKQFFSASRLSTTRCEYLEDLEHDVDDCPSGYTETERFFQSLEYHRSILSDYHRRWSEESDDHGDDDEDQMAKKRDPVLSWPRNVPSKSQIPALELDLAFCLRSPNMSSGDSLKRCQDMQFRIASYYINQDRYRDQQRKGVKMLEELAQGGHADAMCLYGLVLNEGRTPFVEADTKKAVEWWRRCVHVHRHSIAMYELAIAMYTGESVAENTEYAVRLFRNAAHLGHAGAAYMLGECLLDGVGTDRDRGNALEWLVTAAELGHRLARRRVFSILDQDYEGLDPSRAEAERVIQEAAQWVNASAEQQVRAVNVERRFSIGGAGGSPPVVSRRKTIVEESRKTK